MDGEARGTDWGQSCGDNCFTLDGDGFTCSRVLDEPEVWRVELLMHDTFLPSVNAFVVRDGGETLVVDAGTSDDFNDTRLMRALLGLGVDPERTTLFCTHAHMDHAGLARELAEAGAHVVISEGVLGDMRLLAVPAWRDEMAARMRAEEYENSTVRVTAYVLNVRDGQGTDAAILTQVGQNEEYEVTGEPVDGWYPVKVGEIDGWVSGEYVEAEISYSYGETREEEETRIAEEKEREEALAREAAAQTIPAGQAVIDYACQFIGNPYVWGGTSLTEGADCSGFVQSVYAHFGIHLPRTSYDMRSAGYEVSYTEAQPGDLILYEGHVGLYMGDGNIVNAMNEADGIGICSALYTDIITVRRVI